MERLAMSKQNPFGTPIDRPELDALLDKVPKVQTDTEAAYDRGLREGAEKMRGECLAVAKGWDFGELIARDIAALPSLAREDGKMTDIVNAYFKQFYPHLREPCKFEFCRVLDGWRHKDLSVAFIFPRMRCADGFSMSVQGHYGAYSRPRSDFADKYTHVEIGFPSEPEDLLIPYCEDISNPTGTVYGYVPIEVVLQVIAKHGGMVE
jgi:hypothetical protein